MINVVIWLGKIKYSAELAIVFARNNIRIVDENFENTDDFIDRFDSLDANVDVLVIADALLLGTDRKKLFQRIRQIEPNIRIVIVFPGYRNQYIEDQISEYKNVYGISDIIYEGNRLDEDYFADVIKKDTYTITRSMYMMNPAKKQGLYSLKRNVFRLVFSALLTDAVSQTRS